MLSMAVDQASAAKVNAVLAIAFAPQVARSLTRSAGSAKTAMVKAMAAELSAKQSNLRKYLVVTEANANRLVSRLGVIGRWKKGIPLVNFNPTGPEPSRGKGRGVRVNGQLYANAFLATMPKSGHRGVFQRRGTKRLPIDELRSMEPMQDLFRRLRPIGIARAQEALKTNLVADLKFALRKRA